MAYVPQQDLEPITHRLLAETDAKLSACEYGELFRLAQAISAADSARATGVALKTAKERRKRIYRKLRVEGANAVTALLLRAALILLLESNMARIAAPDRSRSAFAGDDEAAWAV